MPKIQHVVLPGRLIGEADSRARETVAGFLRRTGWSTTRLPTICAINGAPVMRAAWRKTRIRKADVVVFQSRPLGGGGGGSSTKSTLGVVGLIALAILAPGVGSLVGGGILGSMLSAGFIAGGSFLLNTFLTPGAKQSDTPQQTLYSFGNQTNSARPLDVIPVRYGRTKVTPDYAAVPWTEVVGDDQYLNVLLVNGLGKYYREQILIDDTVLWDRETGWNSAFSGVQVQFIEPGDQVTLFPANVATSTEVAGQELADPAIWIGGGIINNAGTTATRIVFDMAYPSGLCVRNSNGSLGRYLSHVQFHRRSVNNSGLPTSGWELATEAVYDRSSDKPFRASLAADVPPGRYEVRGRRVVPKGYLPNSVDTVYWTGARAYLAGTQTFSNVSMTAIRMPASQLTQASSGRFGLIDTRILPVWSGSGWVDQPTRLPAYAKLDIATNTDYGARRPTSKVDLQAVVDLAATNASRGDFFDYEFRSTVPVTDALDTALSVCRAKHRWLGDVLSVVREKWHAVPSMLITDREIVRNSFSVDYLLQAEDSADSLILEYLDQDTWQVETVQVPEGMPVATASRVQVPGIVQRAQAYRECAFLWRQNAYRRIRPTITTEQDGRLLSVGSVITLQSEIPMEWGAAAAVVQRSGNSLTLDPPPAWGEGGQTYIIIRQPTGAPFGPIKCTRGTSDALAILDATDLALVQTQQGTTLDDVLARTEGDEPASAAIGLGTEWQQRCIVMSGAPDGDHVQLELVVDYEEVHDDSGSPGDVPPAPVLAIPKTPLVTGLITSLEQNLLEPMLTASWLPAPGALSYVAEVSYDEGNSWVSVAQPTAPWFSAVVEPRAMWLRVAAVGSSMGAYTQVEIAAPTITGDKLPPEFNAQAVRELVAGQIGSVADRLDAIQAEQSLLDADMMARIDDHITTVDRSIRTYYNVQVISLQQADAAQVAQITTLQTSTDSAFAAVTGTLSSLTTSTLAIASSVTELEASVGDIDASLRVSYVVTAAPEGAMAAYEMRARAENVSVGMTIVAKSDGTGYVAFDATKMLLGNVAMFDLVEGNLYLNGSIYARNVAVETLSAITANMGTLTAGRLLSPDGKVDFNLSAGYLLVSS